MSVPEGETATGPNYPIPVTIDVEIASAQTVNDLTVTDTLPPTLQFVAFTNTAGCTPTQTPSTTTPGGQLALDCGDGGTGSFSITYTVFVPENDASGAVLAPPSFSPRTIRNDSQVSGTFDDDANPATPDVGISENGPQTDATVTAKANPARKTVAVSNDVSNPGPTPGDTLTYTLTMDVSDFVTVSAVVLTDTLGDGQTFLESFDPTFAVTENGVATNGTFALGSTYTVSAKDGAGRTTIVFDLSAALVQAGEDGDLAGDQAADGAIGQGPTRVTITFRSIIDAQFSGPVPGNPLIQAGDPIGNDLTVSAQTPGGRATQGNRGGRSPSSSRPSGSPRRCVPPRRSAARRSPSRASAGW